MIRASTLRPIFIAGVALMATLLAACGDNNGGLVNSATPPISDFKPVPVSPIIGDVVLGNKDAKVELVEYAALTCHVCRDFAKQIFPRLKAAYIDTGKVKYIYRDYPLEAGPDGKASDGFGVVLASVARCKGADKFYEIVDDVFGNQGDLLDAAREGKALPLVADIAMKHGMTLAEMRTCIDFQPDLRASIKKSRNDGGDKYKITGTPTIIIDGVKVDDHGWENLSKVIDAKLNGTPLPAAPAAGAAPAPATPPAK
jgi:protein-disulfide isomerase